MELVTPFRLDETNTKLLELLQMDARRSTVELGRLVGRAESTVRDRLAALEAAGVIRGYVALVDPAKLGLAARAIVRGGCRERVPQTANRLLEIPFVSRLAITDERRPLHVELASASAQSLDDIISGVLAEAGLVDVETTNIVQERGGFRPVPVRQLARGVESRWPAAELVRETRAKGRARSAMGKD